MRPLLNVRRPSAHVKLSPWGGFVIRKMSGMNKNKIE